MSSAEYILDTGAAAERRLAIVEEAYGPASHDLVNQLGIMAGMQILDVGCGTGAMLKHFADTVGTTGKVVGFDNSAEQLEFSKQRVAALGITACEFVQGHAHATGLPAASFDLVYSRFLFLHLNDPAAVVSEMRRLAKPGGVIVCEDISMKNGFTIPKSEPIDTIKKIIYQAAASAGIDWDIGLRLYGLLQRAGLRDVDVKLVPQMYSSGEVKRLPEYTLLEIAKRLIQANALTEDMVRGIAAGAKVFTDRDDSLVGLPLLVQVWGRV